MKNKFLNALVIAMVLFHAVAPISALAWVGTDEPEYSPGSDVTISGDNSDNAGYQAGETVHVDVSGPNGYTAACEGIADTNGAWSCQVTLRSDSSAVGTYTYTATGLSSGVSQSGMFLDALSITSISPNSGPITGGTSVTITGTGFVAGQAPFVVKFGGDAATSVTRIDNTHLSAVTPAHVAGTVDVEVTDKTGTGATLMNGFTYGKATATVTLSNLTQTYTGSAQTPTAITNPAGLTIVWTNAPQTNVGSYLVKATINDPNYQGSASGTFVITKADAICTVIGWTGTYDGAEHGASGSCTGVGDVDLSAGLNLGAKFTDYPGGTANWTFTNDNYKDQSGNATVTITKADAICTVAGDSGVYDGAAHGASGSCTGIGGETLSGLVIDPTTYTNVPGGLVHWTFTNDNYKDQSGNATVTITKADATVSVVGFSGVYDGDPHGVVSSSAKGVKDEDLSGLVIASTTYTDVPGGSIHWTFTNNNYKDQSSDVFVTITKANAIINITPYNVTYDGVAHKATGTATGVKGEDLSTLLDLSGTSHTNAGMYLFDTFGFAGNNNYKSDSGLAGMNKIAKANAVINITGYTGVYNAAPHGASGTAVGVESTPGDLNSLLHLGASFTNVPGGTAHWTFDGNGNYNSANGDVAIVISKADAVCTVNGWTGNYDGAYHGATGSCSGVGGEGAGTLALGASFKDVPGGTAHWAFTGNGNYKDQSGDVAIVIKSWWTLNGFFQPVDMGNVWNTVKNGSTVPLKFRILAGTTELTDVSAVKSLTYQMVACNTLGAASEDAIETLAATGGTVLRYSDGQFIFNWKTPSTASKCYRVTMTAQDASTIIAYFKLK